ncbi:MAG: helix-turn-helix domain-containing protein, partial [Planctomycetota bacterium]
MKAEKLFQIALNLDSPWEIEKVEFPEENKQLEIVLNFPKGSRFPCPECGKLCGVHDTQEKTWRHLNFFQYETYLRARHPRVICETHKVKTAEIPWARPSSGFTLLFEALVMSLAQNGMTAKAISRLVGEHDTLIWRIL